MSSLHSIQPGAYALTSLSASRSAEARPADASAAVWLDAGAQAGHGGSQVLHVSANGPGSIDRIEQDFIAALCGSVDAAR